MSPESNPQGARFKAKLNGGKRPERTTDDTTKNRHDVTPKIDITARVEKKRKAGDEKLASETKKLKSGEIEQVSENLPNHMATH